jgi:polynucleotide 5'-hydroxyl-kinase GRC3/NOL9
MTLDVPPAWAELIVSLAAMSWHRLVVLGGTDAGKSSFCRLLSRHLASRSQPVALLDADLGQKMIGPPACVSLVRCKADGSLELERIRFVGEVSEATNIVGTVAATARLAGAAGAARLVVYTSGLIHGARHCSEALEARRARFRSCGGDRLYQRRSGAARRRTTARAGSPPAAIHSRPAEESRTAGRQLPDKPAHRARRLPVGADAGLVVEDLHRTALGPGCLRLCGLADATGDDRAVGLVRWSDYLD